MDEYLDNSICSAYHSLVNSQPNFRLHSLFARSYLFHLILASSLEKVSTYRFCLDLRYRGFAPDSWVRIVISYFISYCLPQPQFKFVIRMGIFLGAFAIAILLRTDLQKNLLYPVMLSYHPVLRIHRGSTHLTNVSFPSCTRATSVTRCGLHRAVLLLSSIWIFPASEHHNCYRDFLLPACF